MSAKKRSVSDDDDDSSSLTSVEDESSKKVSKKKKLDNDGDNKSKKSDSSSIKANGEKILDLTGKKYVSITQFKNRIFVDIREYYEDRSTGKLKPGKKGVALNREQWVKLKSMIDEIDADLENRL